MQYPEYIAVVRANRDNTRGSHMELRGGVYETFGWSLDISYIEWFDGYGKIRGFMPHLNGAIIEPISESVYKADKWGVKTKIKE